MPEEEIARGGNEPVSAQPQQRVVVEEEKGLRVSDVFRMIIKHWKGLILFTVAGTAAAAVYGFAFKKPVWTSKSSAIVLVRNDSGSATIDEDGYTQQEYQYSLQLAKTCADAVMNSTYVYKLIIQDVNADGRWGQYNPEAVSAMSKLVSAKSDTTTAYTTSTPIVTITSSTNDKDYSMFLANAMLEHGVTYATTDETFKGLFGTNGVKKVSYATVPNDTSMNKWAITAIGAAAGLVVGAAYGIIFEVANTHVVSGRELENDLGVKLIGTIPDIEATYNKSHQRKGKRRHAV